jgi:hypothetical protein
MFKEKTRTTRPPCKKNHGIPMENVSPWGLHLDWNRKREFVELLKKFDRLKASVELLNTIQGQKTLDYSS